VTRSVAGVRLGPGASAYQRTISNNSSVHDEQGDNLGQKKRGFDGVLYKLWTLQAPWSSSVKFAWRAAATAWVEVNRLGWSLAGVIHRASQS